MSPLMQVVVVLIGAAVGVAIGAAIGGGASLAIFAVLGILIAGGVVRLTGHAPVRGQH